MSHLATCVCGNLNLVFDGEIHRTSICHCFACQKRTGSVFAVQTRLDRSLVTVTGESSVFLRIGDAGSHAKFHFCPTCGSTLFWEVEVMPESVIVAVGAFADPHLASPTFSVYEDRMHHWVQLPQSITEHLN